MNRREWLQQIGLAGLSLSSASLTVADTRLQQEALLHNDTLLKIVGKQNPVQDTRVQVLLPSNAVNGAVVPVGVISDVPDTQQIVVLVSEHSRDEVMRLDTTHPAIQPRFSTHLQLLKPTIVTALVQTQDQWFVNRAKVDSLGERC